MVPKAFESGAVAGCLLFAAMFAVAGCQTLEHSPNGVQRIGDRRRSPGLPTANQPHPRAQGMALLSPTSDPGAANSVGLCRHRPVRFSHRSARLSTPAPSDKRGGGDAESRQYVRRRGHANTILGDILGLNYSVNPNLAGKITIQTSTPVSKSDLSSSCFQNALRSSGAIIIRNGGMYQSEPTDQFSKSVPEITVGSAAGSQSGIVGTSARVVQLQFVAASEMHRILEPMAQGAILRADDARNTLTLSGTGSDIGAMLDAISVFDADVMKRPCRWQSCLLSRRSLTR